MVEKQTIVQRDFSLGVMLPGFIDADDLEMRSQSLKAASDLRVSNSRTLVNRPCTGFKALAVASWKFFEIRVQNGGVETLFSVVLKPNSLEIWDTDYTEVETYGTVPWGADPSTAWVASFQNATVFGGSEFYVLTYDEGTWDFGALAFAEQGGGEKSLPYWSYKQGISLTPSAYTGSVTVTASADLFSADWVGDRIRYAQKELLITAYTSTTSVTATVATELPPTFTITFSSAADLTGFRIGQVVTASQTNWTGIITNIVGAVMTAVTLNRDPAFGNGELVSSHSGAAYGGPLTSDEIVGPNSAVSPSSVLKAANPVACSVWDEQLWSDRRGWPRSGVAIDGRLALCDFPLVPNLVAISSPRAFNDFGQGLNDDDAIVRQGGNNNARFRHMISALDLIILADRGCYYVKTRDGEVLSPSNFQIVQFSERGCGPVRPALIESNVVFVERGRSAIAACVLDGNVYLNWSVVDVSALHGSLINRPVAICGAVESSDFDERYMLVANTPTTVVAGVTPEAPLAVMSWFSNFGANQVGFIPWRLGGQILDTFELFGKYHVIVTRGSDVAGYRTTLEAFEPDYFLDAAVPNVGDMTAGDPCSHLPKDLDAFVWSGRKSEAVRVDATGNLYSPPTLIGGYVGVYSEPFAEPWPREIIQSPRHGMIKARVIRAGVSVRETVTITFLRNSTASMIPPYGPMDNLAEMPPLKTDRYRFNIFGNRTHPEMRFSAGEPNRFEITEIIQEVQG